MQHPLEQLRHTAVQAARQAGSVQLRYYGADLRVDFRHAHDLKLEVDRLCEEVILDTIQQTFPDHAIMTEERGVIERPSDYVWIVDPLDGTVNFFNGLAHFCTCVACYYRGNGGRGSTTLGEPLVGVVYAPLSDELFVGVAGKGATRNQHPLRLRTPQRLDDAIVGLSFGSSETTMQRMERLTSMLIRCCHKVRVLGSCGLDIAHVACNRLGAHIQQHVRSWDFAAARIILEEAGGVLEALEVEPNRWNIIACFPEAFPVLQEMTRTL